MPVVSDLGRMSDYDRKDTKKRLVCKYKSLPCSVWKMKKKKKKSYFVSWCFKTSFPQRILSGLKETFINKYIAERTNEAEIRPEEQSEKV